MVLPGECDGIAGEFQAWLHNVVCKDIGALSNKVVRLHEEIQQMKVKWQLAFNEAQQEVVKREREKRQLLDYIHGYAKQLMVDRPSKKCANANDDDNNMQNAAVTPSTEDKFAKEPSSVESSDFYRFAKDTPSADPSAFAPDRAYLFADPVPANENSFCAGDGERDGDCDAPAPSSFQLAPNAEAVTTQPAFSINLKTPHPDPLNANPAKRTLALSPEPEGQPKKQKLFL